MFNPQLIAFIIEPCFHITIYLHSKMVQKLKFVFKNDLAFSTLFLISRCDDF